jgi:hypothetical protein
MLVSSLGPLIVRYGFGVFGLTHCFLFVEMVLDFGRGFASCTQIPLLVLLRCIPIVLVG